MNDATGEHARRNAHGDPRSTCAVRAARSAHFIGVLWLCQTYLASTDDAWRPAGLKQGTLDTPYHKHIIGIKSTHKMQHVRKKSKGAEPTRQSPRNTQHARTGPGAEAGIAGARRRIDPNAQ